jgi:cysteine desulfurase/selenocysteine lyase
VGGRRHDTALVGEALARLGEVEDLEVYGPRDPDVRAGVISFNFPGVHPHDLSAALDTEGVAVRAGHHCAQPLMRRLGVTGTARASFFVHTGADDIAALVAALQHAREVLGAGRLRPSTR